MGHLKEKLNQLSDLWEPFKAKLYCSEKPNIKIKLIPTKPLTPWQSKVGGLAYQPKKEVGATYYQAYPTNEKREALCFLAQINLSEVPLNEALLAQGYPDKGLLQFFVADDELMGLNFDNYTDHNGFRIRYFAEIITEESLLEKEYLQTNNTGYLPIAGEFLMQFQLSSQVITIEDFSFGQQILGVENLYDYETIFERQHKGKHDFWEDFFEPFAELFTDEPYHQLGGYPFFTQTDPRVYAKGMPKEVQLLFQLDSDSFAEENYFLMWGDSGVGNFFIRPEDLKARDFSKVYYNWDCY